MLFFQVILAGKYVFSTITHPTECVDEGVLFMSYACGLNYEVHVEFFFIPDAYFTTVLNLLVFETRVKFCTQEIVFFRQNLLYRMRRSCLMPPSTEETSDPFEHVGFIFILWFSEVEC